MPEEVWGVAGTPAVASAGRGGAVEAKSGMSRHSLPDVRRSFGSPELTPSGLPLARTACGRAADGAGHFQRGGVP